MRTSVLPGPGAARLMRGAGLVALITAALAGCSAGPMDTRAAYEAHDAAGSEGAAMASLPAAAGAQMAVVESRAHGVLTQRIVLRGDPGTVGENAIVVRVLIDRGPTDLDGPVGVPTRGKIAAELEENFPGVDMGFSQAFAHNSLGPFGYAIGHPRAGETCFYGWQLLVFKPSLLGSLPTGEPSLPTQPTSVRVRLCRTSLGEAEMVQLMKDLQVFPPNSRVPYMDPAYTTTAADGDALGAVGVGNFAAPAMASAASEPVTPHVRKVVRHRRHHMHEAAREERAVADDPAAPGSVAVPMPGGSAAPAASTENPLLAPLAVSKPVERDDLPMPGARQATITQQPQPTPLRTSIPLPN